MTHMKRKSTLVVVTVLVSIVCLMLVGCGHAAKNEKNASGSLQVVTTADAPAAIGPYSQGIIANGFVYASGQIALDPKTGELVGTDIQTQSEQVMKNITALLQAAGTDTNHVVKTTCYLADINDFSAFNEVYGKYFNETLPARSAVGVAALPKGALVEVEVIAAVK